MDQKLVDQSIDYHGPELVDGLYKDQVNVVLPNFLTLPQNSKNKETPKDPDFEKMVVSFVSKKADLIFKTKKQDQKKTSTEDALEHLTRLPPVEYFMGVQNEHRKEHYNKSVEKGDIVFGTVAAVQQQGLLIHLICLDDLKARDIKQLKIAAFCPSRELPKLYAHESPIDAFAIKDKVRGIVTSVSRDKDAALVIISLLQDKIPQNQPAIKIGLISDEELPEYFKHMKEGRNGNYLRELMKSQGFSNPSDVTTLTDMFDIDETMAPSLMRGLHAVQYNKTDFAEELRKTQSYRLALKSVAEGVDFFKKEKHVEAMQHLNKALEIDSENVEGLVARGALYANNESYSRAIEDFEKALEINPNHNNAKTYMSETLLVHSRGLMDQNMEQEAAVYLEKVLKLNPNLKEAQRVLGEIKKKLAEQERSPEAVVVTDSEPEEVIDEKSLIKKTADTLRMIMEEENSNRRNKRKKLCSPERSRSTSTYSKRDSVILEDNQDKPEKSTSKMKATEFDKMVSKTGPLSPGTEAFIKSKFQEEKARSLGIEYTNPENKPRNTSGHLNDTNQDVRFSNPENERGTSHYDGMNQDARFSNSHLAHGYSDRVGQTESNLGYRDVSGHGDDSFRYEKEVQTHFRGYAQMEEKGDGNYEPDTKKDNRFYEQNLKTLESSYKQDINTDSQSCKQDIDTDSRSYKQDFHREDTIYKQHFDTEDRSYGQSISFHEIMEQLQDKEKSEKLMVPPQSLYNRKNLPEEQKEDSPNRKGDKSLWTQNTGISQAKTTSDSDAWKDEVNQFVTMLQTKHKKNENWTDPNKPQVARIKPLQTAPSDRGRSRSPESDSYTERRGDRSRSPDSTRFTGKHGDRSRSPGRHGNRSKSPGRHRNRSKSPGRHGDGSKSPGRHGDGSRSPGRHGDRSRSRDSTRFTHSDPARSPGNDKFTATLQPKNALSDKVLPGNKFWSSEKDGVSSKQHYSQRSKKRSPSAGKNSGKKDKKRSSRSKSPSQGKTYLKPQIVHRSSTSQKNTPKTSSLKKRTEEQLKELICQGSTSMEGHKEIIKEKETSAGNIGGESIVDRLKRLSQLDIGHDLNKQTVKVNLSSLPEKSTVTKKDDGAQHYKKDKEFEDFCKKRNLSKTSKERELSANLTVMLKRKISTEKDFPNSAETYKKTKTQDHSEVKLLEKKKVKGQEKLQRDRKRNEKSRDDKNQGKKSKYTPDKNVHNKSHDRQSSEKRRRSQKNDSPDTKKTRLMKSKWDRDSASDESEKERKQQKTDKVKETLAEMEGFLKMLKTNKKTPTK